MTEKSSITEVAAATEDDWITLLKDNGRTGGFGAPTVPSPAKARWQLRLGSPVRSSPVLREATLYVTAQRGQLYALKTKDGRQEWKFEAGGKITFDPVAERTQRAVRLRQRKSVRSERRQRSEGVGVSDRTEKSGRRR